MLGRAAEEYGGEEIRSVACEAAWNYWKSGIRRFQPDSKLNRVRRGRPSRCRGTGLDDEQEFGEFLESRRGWPTPPLSNYAT